MNNQILTKHERTLYQAERLHVLQYPGIAQLFLLACIVADGFTLFTVVDQLLTQQTDVTWVITLTIATVINVLPMLIAAALRNEEFSRKMKAFLITMMTSMFLLLFGVTFALRFSAREEMFHSTSQLGITFEGGEGTEEKIENESTQAQDILAVILGLEPALTSACTFVLAYEASPKRKRRHLLEVQRHELLNKIERDQVMLAEIDGDIAYDLDAYDITQYEGMQELIREQGERAMALARRKLAVLKEQTPEAVSYLMEGEYKTDMKEVRVKKTEDIVSWDSEREIRKKVVA